MHIDWWTLGLQTVNVLVLIWLLKRFLFAPVAAMIEERRKTAAMILDEAKAARDKAEALRADVTRQAAEAADARDKGLAAAAEEAAALKSRLTAEAHAEAEKLRQQATAEAERQRVAAMSTLARQADALAVEITGKLLDRLPPDARIGGFIDGLAEAIAALSPEDRGRLAADGAITLRAARPLTAEEQAQFRARTTGVLASPVDITFEVDDSLIAGLEIVSPYVRVRNSFRADLERISSELEKSGSAR